MATEPQLAIVVERLCRYLRDHPHACDTPTAIARWWLGPDVVPQSALLEEALRSLQQRGLIEPQHAADGRVRYRRTDTSAVWDAKLDELLRQSSAATAGSRAAR